MSKMTHSIVLIILVFNLFQLSNSLTFVQLFGLQPLLEDLVKGVPLTHYTGQNSVSYAVHKELFQFVKNFQTRTRFCDYKCPNFYQLPCFILFQCNIHIRNFFLIIIAPLIVVIMIGLCCGKGIWTFSCWARYLGLFTGIFFILWFLKKFLQGHQINERRQKQREYIHQKRLQNDIENQQIFTQKRLKENN